MHIEKKHRRTISRPARIPRPLLLRSSSSLRSPKTTGEARRSNVPRPEALSGGKAPQLFSVPTAHTSGEATASVRPSRSRTTSR